MIGDRFSCVSDLSQLVQTETGTEFCDTLRFFVGDHPAIQFEKGTKQGGTYKCGACGCQEHLYDDQAHCLQRRWRLPQQLQSVATNGKLGDRPGIIHPFDNLRVNELRSELEARGVVLEDKVYRADLQKSLDLILKGVSRVPALLLTNPTQYLVSLNIHKYEIMASEPLHDIKGHIINLILDF